MTVKPETLVTVLLVVALVVGMIYLYFSLRFERWKREFASRAPGVPRLGAPSILATSVRVRRTDRTSTNGLFRQVRVTCPRLPSRCHARIHSGWLTTR